MQSFLLFYFLNRGCTSTAKGKMGDWCNISFLGPKLCWLATKVISVLRVIHTEDQQCVLRSHMYQSCAPTFWAISCPSNIKLFCEYQEKYKMTLLWIPFFWEQVLKILSRARQVYKTGAPSAMQIFFTSVTSLFFNFSNSHTSMIVTNLLVISPTPSFKPLHLRSIHFKTFPVSF